VSIKFVLRVKSDSRGMFKDCCINLDLVANEHSAHASSCVTIQGTDTLFLFRELQDLDTTKFRVQLSIAIMCMLLVFVAGVERTAVYGGCVLVSVLLHYFSLAAVMWMGAEAVLQLRMTYTDESAKKIIIIIKEAQDFPHRTQVLQM